MLCPFRSKAMRMPSAPRTSHLEQMLEAQSALGVLTFSQNNDYCSSCSISPRIAVAASVIHHRRAKCELCVMSRFAESDRYLFE